MTLATRLPSQSQSPPPRPSPNTAAVACVAAAVVGSCSDFLEPLARTWGATSQSRSDIAFEQWNKFAADLCKSPASLGLQSACGLGRLLLRLPWLLLCQLGRVYCPVIRPRPQKCNSFSCSRLFVMNEAAHAQCRKKEYQTRQTRKRRDASLQSPSTSTADVVIVAAVVVVLRLIH